MKALVTAISLEALEARIAPAGLLNANPPSVHISADGKTATFTDVDGDIAKFVTTKGSWADTTFDLTATGDLIGGNALKSITIPAAANFTGANITITAKRDLFGGNG